MMIRVILIANGDPRRVLLLAEQIELHVPDAKISGIIYKAPVSSQFGFASRIEKGLSSFRSGLIRLTLRLIHGGGLRKSEASGSARDFLSAQCREAGWDLCDVEDFDSARASEFANQKGADLGVAIGLASIPAALVAIPRQGMIQGLIFSVSEHGSEARFAGKGTVAVSAIRLEVNRITCDCNESLADFNLCPQPLDTCRSLELKSNLIFRDLLVQSVAVLARHPEREAAAQVAKWAKTMIPSCFEERGAASSERSCNQAPLLQVRPAWKLAFYSLFLLFPFVMLRNWVRRWRKKHPLVFLNSHLISDRHHRMTLPTEAFFHEVEFLRRYYRIVSLSEACKLLNSGFIDEPILVLTFDDGYEDNFVNLRAVSEEMGIPVVLFVATQAVTDHREFTHDYERGLRGFRALTWDQIRYWTADGTEFHSHACSHFDCGSKDEAALEKEMAESKRVLEGELGKPVTSFAFPFGKPKNMSAPALSMAGQMYDYFLSSFGGENFPRKSESHKHLLRRHLQGNAWETELELQGVFEIAHSLKRLLQLGRKRSGSSQVQAGDRTNANEPQIAGS